MIALETALSAPARVRSLAFLEPILTEVPGVQEFMAGMEPVMSLYAAGDMAGAASTTFAGLGGPGWRELLATAGPDALDLAIRDTELFCRAEAPSLTTWTLDETRAAAVRSPVLSVMGTQSGPFFKEGRQLLHQRFLRDNAVPPGCRGHAGQRVPARCTAGVRGRIAAARGNGSIRSHSASAHFVRFRSALRGPHAESRRRRRGSLQPTSKVVG